MAATIMRYNFSQLAEGGYAPIDDSGRMPLAWLIGDTLAAIILAPDCSVESIRLRIGSDYVTVSRQLWRVSVFIADCTYSRRVLREIYKACKS